MVLTCSQKPKTHLCCQSTGGKILEILENVFFASEVGARIVRSMGPRDVESQRECEVIPVGMMLMMTVVVVLKIAYLLEALW